MGYIFITIFSMVLWLPRIQMSDKFYFIEEIVKARPIETFSICGIIIDDEDQQNLIRVLQKNNLFYVQQNCTTIWEQDKTVMVFYKPTTTDFRSALDKPGVQRSLSLNVWIVYLEKLIDSIEEYFSEIRLRVGINANIFFIYNSDQGYKLMQVIGTATSKVETIVRALDYAVKTSTNYFLVFIGSWTN